jgi:hypothetical protein
MKFAAVETFPAFGLTKYDGGVADVVLGKFGSGIGNLFQNKREMR